jgi:hypothetical protein
VARCSIAHLLARACCLVVRATSARAAVLFAFQHQLLLTPCTTTETVATAAITCFAHAVTTEPHRTKFFWILPKRVGVLSVSLFASLTLLLLHTLLLDFHARMCTQTVHAAAALEVVETVP